MKIFKTKAELCKWREACKAQSVGFVPTMGALHLGHLSLIQKAKKECQKIVVSIFINNLQFGPHEDFKQYPRLIEQDILLLKNKKVDVLFLPDQNEIYPKGFAFKIDEINIGQKLEGASRPKFFSGVIMIVLKLFNLVQPKFAYFGEKDIQQLYIIKKMIDDLNFQIVLRGCETIREKNGLAMSSRNDYLADDEKKEAAILYQTLKKGKELIKKNQTMQNIKKEMQEMLINKNIEIDYLAIVDLNTFEETEQNAVRPLVIAGAVYYKKVRLIDNIIIKK